MIETTTPSNWKTKYKESTKAILQKEQLLSECEKLLNEAVAQLCETSLKQPPGLEKALKKLQEISLNGASQTEIALALANLRKKPDIPASENGFIRRIFGTRNLSTEEPTARLSAQQLLLQLLDKLTIPESHRATANAIRKKLSTAANDLEIIGSLDQIVEIIGKIRADLIVENMELNQFLVGLGEMFKNISTSVQTIGSLEADNAEKQTILTSTLEAQVLAVSSNLASNSNVQPLFKTLLHSIYSYKKEAELINGSRAEEVGALTKKISTLKEEADELKSKLKDYHAAAYQDGLTKIPNRPAYDYKLKEEYARWKRFDHPVSLLVWDIDKFKGINDTYGHQAGDNILKSVASLLQDNIRETDFVARYGGEEFVIILPGAQVKFAKKIAEKLRKKIEAMIILINKKRVPVTASCGISEFRKGDGLEHVFLRADKALYSAKGAGRNAVVLN